MTCRVADPVFWLKGPNDLDSGLQTFRLPCQKSRVIFFNFSKNLAKLNVGRCAKFRAFDWLTTSGLRCVGGVAFLCQNCLVCGWVFLHTPCSVQINGLNAIGMTDAGWRIQQFGGRDSLANFPKKKIN